MEEKLQSTPHNYRGARTVVDTARLEMRSWNACKRAGGLGSIQDAL